MRGMSVLLALVLAGCASSPTPQSEAKEAKVLDGAFLESAGKVPLIVTRDQGGPGSLCDHSMALDGAVFVHLRPGSQAAVYVQPGEHILALEVTGVGCGGGSAGVRFVATPGKRAAFRTAVANDASIVPMP